jgi:hypothetical protein
VGRKVGWRAVPIVWGIFPTLHISHGIGFAAGLLRYGFSPDWADPEILSPLRDEVTFLGEPAEA